MQGQLAIQKILKDRYLELKRKNSSYSIRAFAKRMRLNSGAMSAILSGKRNVSIKLARGLCERLGLDPQQKVEVLELFPQKRAYTKVSQQSPISNYLQLSAAQFRIVAEWQHFAILVLMRTKGFKSDLAWIASRLGISPVKVEQSITRLIEIGALAKSSKGKLKRITQKFRTTDDVVDASLKRSHEETMDLAKESLYRHAVKERDFTHISVAIHPKNLGIAKELIRKFEDDFAKIVESEDATEVYRLSMQFFPLTVIGQEISDEK